MTPSRNAPCSCGSGRKYKRCCYAADARAAAANAFDTLEAQFPEDDRWFGYDASVPDAASPFDLPEHGLVCMAWAVSDEDVEYLRARGHLTFSHGAWAVSTGAHEATVVHGPFPDMGTAFDFARTTLGAVRFRQSPSFHAGG